MSAHWLKGDAWTKAEEAFVAGCYRQGLNYDEIAGRLRAALGRERTRNAVKSVVARLPEHERKRDVPKKNHFDAAEDELLAALWRDGASAQTIAARLNERFGRARSRNSVLGQINRAHPELKRYVVEGRARPVRSLPRRMGAAKQPSPVPQAPSPKPHVIASPQPLRQRVNLSAVAQNPVEFLERQPDQCCFPLWPEKPGRLVCGDPTVSRTASWCPAHLRIVAVPVSKGDRT